MKKMTLDEFLEYEEQSEISNTWDSWHNRSLFAKMMDIWAAADEVVKIYNQDKSSLLHQISNLHDLCRQIYSSYKYSYGFKWELKIAEWELYDFCLWDNTFQNTADTIMKRWFDQWCYDINYDLL